MIFDLPITDILVFNEVLISSLKVEDIVDTLILTEEYLTNIKFEDISDQLTFFEQLKSGGDFNKNVSDTLILVESFVRSKIGNVTDNLVLTELLDNRILGDNLSLGEVFDYQKSKWVADQLVLNEIFGFNIKKVAIVSDNLVLDEGFAGSKIQTCIVSVQVNTHTVVLARGTDILILPSPNFEDVRRLNFLRINSRTRGGDPIVFRESSWAKSKVLIYKWTYLKEDIREKLIKYIRRNLGKLIVLTNHEGNSYNVVIQNPDSQMVQSGRYNHEISLSFEIE